MIHYGSMYRCISAITTAEAWTPAHWTQVNTGGELEDLKSALDITDTLAQDGVYTVPANSIIQGTYNVNGSVSANSKRIRIAKPIKVLAGSVLRFKAGTTINGVFLGISTNGGASYTDTVWQMQRGIRFFAQESYVIAVFKSAAHVSDSGADILPSAYDATLTITSSVAEQINDAEECGTVLVGDHVNLFDKNDENMVTGAYISIEPLGEIDVSENASLTGFIPVSNGKTYDMHCYAKGDRISIVVYDSNKIAYDYFWKSVPDNVLYDANGHLYVKLTFGATSRARYVRYNVPIGGTDYCMFVEGTNNSTMPSEYIPFDPYDHIDPSVVETEYQVTIEGGGFENNNSLTYGQSDFANYKRTAYFVDVNGARAVGIDWGSLTPSTVTMRYFDSTMTMLSKVTRTAKFDLMYPLPSGTKYIKFSCGLSTAIDRIGLKVIGNSEAIEEVKGKQYNTPSEKLTFRVYDDVITTARLILPSVYDPIGAPVPLVLWMDGSGNFTSWNGNFNEQKLPYLQYLASEGFAVLSIFGWGNQYLSTYSNCGNAYPYPIPICLACMNAGVKYALSRFNIDADNIHIMSKSQGGQVAYYWASHPDFRIRSIGMFAPVLDYLSMPGESLYADTRKAIAAELQLTGDTEYFGSTSFNAYTNDAKTFWQANLSKINGLNEAWLNITDGTLAEKYAASIANGEAFWDDITTQSIYQDTDKVRIACVPVKIWGAADDDATPYLKMVEAVKQIENGGTETQIRTFANNTGKHNCADLGTNVESSVTAADGTVYTDLPSGWYENVLWMRAHMPTR